MHFHRLSLASLVLCLLAALPLAAQDGFPPRAEIMQEMAHAISAPLRNSVPGMDHKPAPIQPVIPVLRPGGGGGGGNGGGGGSWSDGDLTSPSSTTAPGASGFAGISANGSIPPDTNLAVGATQVVQVVNTEYQVWDKSGNSQLGPAAMHTAFTALGGLCASSDGGDPVVLYDQLAGRWILSQLEYTTSFKSNLLCVAVSQTSDATGSYNLYAFSFGNYLPDYPKLGVWPDAYYLSANMFRNGSSFTGAKACAFDRNAMLAGTAASAVCFQGSTVVYNLLPASLDGATGPPAGEPNFFLQFTASSGVGSALNLYRFHVNFSGGSSMTGPTALSVKSYHEACSGGACVPQLHTNEQLDSLGDRLMYRLQYRNFGSHESLVVNHSVQVASTSAQTGVRWYEIRNPNGTPVVTQQGTYSPDVTTYRWMGSIAQDKAGNMALGYSASSSAMFPGIRFAVRGASDPLGALGGESIITNGSGSQTTYNRWGDYSSMTVDPADDCTFWYTTEYLPSTGNFNWVTQIASFKMSSCN